MIRNFSYTRISLLPVVEVSVGLGIFVALVARLAFHGGFLQILAAGACGAAVGGWETSRSMFAGKRAYSRRAWLIIIAAGIGSGILLALVIYPVSRGGLPGVLVAAVCGAIAGAWTASWRLSMRQHVVATATGLEVGSDLGDRTAFEWHEVAKLTAWGSDLTLWVADDPSRMPAASVRWSLLDRLGITSQVLQGLDARFGADRIVEKRRAGLRCEPQNRVLRFLDRVSGPVILALLFLLPWLSLLAYTNPSLVPRAVSGWMALGALGSWILFLAGIAVFAGRWRRRIRRQPGGVDSYYLLPLPEIAAPNREEPSGDGPEKTDG